MDSFELELKQGFLEEAAQLLVDAEQCFLSMESNPKDEAIVEKIFRLAHNLKGSSKAVGFDDLGLFTHEFENLLLKFKRGEIPVSPGLITLLLQCNDHLKNTVDALRADVTAIVNHEEMTAAVKAAGAGEFNSTPSAESNDHHEEAFLPPPQQSSTENYPTTGEDVKMDEIENLKNAAESIASNVSDIESFPDSHVASEPAISEVSGANAPAGASAHPGAVPPSQGGAPKSGENKSDESIRVSLARLEKLINFVGEMVILQTVLKEQAHSENMNLLRRTVHQLGKVGKEIQDMSMSLRMVPLKQTFQKMQRIVRDTSNLLDKKVNLVMSGEETELDKTVLESVADPLVHLIRNAVDHGIENKERRLESKKPEIGTVFLNAYHQGGRLVIEVKDDGGGINPDVLLQKAKEKGLLKPGQTLTREQCVHLVFHPGFSTKAQVTEVSGRGVGMDVVKTNVEALQGEIQIFTEVGRGTTFKIVLPLTLAIIDGMVVRMDEQRFVIPLSHVHESVRPAKGDVKKLTGLGEILLLRGENLPLYRLSTILNWKREEKTAEDGIAIVVRAAGDPFCILVDDIIGQHQVVIKKLGQEMQHLKGFSGSSILGDGKPALILELSELIRASAKGTVRGEQGRIAA